MNRIYLVRHGENPANLTKEFSHHQVDYSLNPKGLLQARQTAEYFRQLKIDELYSSPLKRAYETAQQIGAATGLTPVVMENFREIHTGELEGQPPTRELWDLHNAIIADWFDGRPERRFPGGEDYHEMWERLEQGLRTITAGKDGHNMIIVGHGGMFSFGLLGLCPGLDFNQLFQIENHNCSISEILLHGAEGKMQGELVRWADCRHLSGAAAEMVSGFVGTYGPVSEAAQANA